MLIKDTSSSAEYAENLKIFTVAGRRPHLTQEQKEALLKTKENSNIKFYLFPTLKVVEAIASGKDNIFSQIPEKIANIFVNSNGILFDQEMIVKRSDGTLDEKNTVLIDLCDVKYAGELPDCIEGGI